MKKFAFSLDTVLNYKNQVLDNLQNEHAAKLAEIRRQEAVIEALKEQYSQCNEDLKREQRAGVTVSRIYTYENYMGILNYKIKHEQTVLAVLKKEEEVKRQQVIEARKESASIEKLKEKKLAEYDKEVQKAEEQLIEEFVANTRTHCMTV